MNDQMRSILVYDENSSVSSNFDKFKRYLSEVHHLIHESPDDFNYPVLEIRTKYYEAEVDLLLISSPNQNLPEACEAIIICWDCVSLESLNDRFEKKLSSMDPKLKLILCQSLDMETDRNSIEKWCVDNKFEFVEIEPPSEIKEELLECGEKVGFERIVEVLQSHTWPNLRMLKNKQQSPSSDRSKLNNRKNCGPSDCGQDELLSDFDNDQAKSDFGALFAKFSAFKSMSENLPDDRRKEFAERVVNAFCNAIDYDEDDTPENDQNC